MNIQVIGAGSWGLALTRLLAINGNQVRLWCRGTQVAEALRTTRECETYLPGVQIPQSVQICDDIDANADMAVLATPSHAMRAIVQQHRFASHTVRVNVAKGIENETLLRMSEVIAESAPGGPVVTLSGPSHAEEVARDLPASVVVAGEDAEACLQAQKAFFSKTFRVYTSPDIVGVELGGSLKNVIAIAAGVCDGFGLGDNATAALITRGLAEISRLGVVCGADPLTFAGLSGMGDLIVTCASRHSRNRRLGQGIAAGNTLAQLQQATSMVAEGVRTTRSAYALARKLGVEMPITSAVHRVLYEDANAMQVMEQLLLREAKPEQG